MSSFNNNPKSKNKESPYLKHLEQDQWNDVNAKHIEEANIWKRIAIISVMGLFIVSIYSMYLTNQDKHKTLIFERDSLGNLQVLGIASRTMQVDNKVIGHQLINFITALREVPLDLSIKKRNIDLVHRMTNSKIRTTIDQMLVTQYIQAKNSITITVQVNNVKPLAGGKSWEIRWTERFGDNPATHWEATVTYERTATTDLATEMVNPAGLFINYINVTQDISDKGQY